MNKKTLDEYIRCKRIYEKSNELHAIIRKRPETATQGDLTVRMAFDTMRFSRMTKKRMEELDPEVRSWISRQSDPEVRAALHLMYIDGKTMSEACNLARTRSTQEAIEKRCQSLLDSLK